MSVIENLIFDRTQADVTRVDVLKAKMLSGNATPAEKAEWLAGMKGAYNASDMNRVTLAVKVLAERMNRNGYGIQYGQEELPQGYRAVEYIESSGTQCVDTGYVIRSENVRIKIHFRYLGNYNTASVFGSENRGGLDGQYSICAYGKDCVLYVGNRSQCYTVGATPNVDTHIEVETKNNRVYVNRDGNMGSESYDGVLNHYQSFGLFGNNIDGTIQQRCPMRLYRFQMWDSGYIVRDMIPVVNAEGMAGLFDALERKFYGNIGSGTFTAGAVTDTSKTPIGQLLPTRCEQWSGITATGTAKIDSKWIATENTTMLIDGNAVFVKAGESVKFPVNEGTFSSVVISEGNMVIHSYIPAKDWNGTSGMYDTVLNQFISKSEGTGKLSVSGEKIVPQYHVNTIYPIKLHRENTLERNETTHTETKTETKPITRRVTAENVSQFFTTKDDTYCFKLTDGTWTNTNVNINGSTAKTVLTALKDMDISFTYAWGTETNYDKFTIVVGTTTVADAVSGSQTTKTYEGKITKGQTITLTYSKDSSNSNNGDTCTMSAFDVTVDETITTTTEITTVAPEVVLNGVDEYLWTYSDTPLNKEILPWLNGLTQIRSVLNLPGGIPTVPKSLEHMVYQLANDIEQMLSLVGFTADAGERMFRVSGTFSCGNNLGVQYFSRGR